MRNTKGNTKEKFKSTDEDKYKASYKEEEGACHF